MVCIARLVLLLSTGFSDCVTQSPNSECVREPKTCLPQDVVARIDKLTQCCFDIDNETLPYACFLFHRHTIPREDRCVPCSDKQSGCPKDHDKGESWQKACDFFCASNTTIKTNASSDQSNPTDTGQRSSKILIIVFCSLVLTLPGIVIIVVAVECVKRFRRYGFRSPAKKPNTTSNENEYILVDIQ